MSRCIWTSTLFLLSILCQLNICLSITEDQFCPTGFRLINSTYCALNGSISKTWKEARDECFEKGGHLPRQIEDLDDIAGHNSVASWSGSRFNGGRVYSLSPQNQCAKKWVECVVLNKSRNGFCDGEVCEVNRTFVCLLQVQNTLWNVSWCPEEWLGSEIPSIRNKCFFINYSKTSITEIIKFKKCQEIGAIVVDTSNPLIKNLVEETITEHWQREIIKNESSRMDDRIFVCEKEKPSIPPRKAVLQLEAVPLIITPEIENFINSTYKLYCRGINVRPNFRIVWYHNGDPYPELDLNETKQIDYLATAQIKLDEAKQGDYWCETWDNVNQSTLISNKITLTLLDINNYVIVITSESASTCMRTADKLSKLCNEFFNEKPRSNIVFRELTMLIDNQLLIWIHSKNQAINDIKLQFENLLKENAGITSSIESLTFRNTEWCLKETTTHNGFKLTWEHTQRNNKCLPKQLSLSKDCTNVYRECIGDFRQGSFWSPVIGDCTNSLYNLSKSEIRQDNVLEASISLDQLTTNMPNEKYTSSDVEYIAETMENIYEAGNVTNETLTHLVNTVNRVMDINNETIISSQELSRSSNRITQILEKIIASVPLKQGKSLNYSQSNIYLEIHQLSSNSDDIVLGIENWNLNHITLNTTIKLNNSDSDVALLLPLSLVTERKILSGNDGLRIQFTVYHKNIFFSAKNRTVISKVIAASFVNQSVQNCEPPIQIAFKPLQDINNKSVNCSFWDPGLNNNSGDWSSEGCWMKSRKPNRIICECNHLTALAILMDVKELENLSNSMHHDILNGITYICCLLSIIGLSMTILTFLLFRKWRKKDGNKLLCNFALALLLFLIVFLAGIEQTDSPTTCKAVAILLHYFILSSFCWMLVEAFQQYMQFVKVLATYIPRFLFKAMMFAWGVPLIIVIIVMGIDIHQYGRARSCWLQEYALYYSFFLPVGIIMFINTIIFVLVIRGITRKSNLRTNQSKVQLMKIRIFTSIFIFVVLGFTWLFGFFSLIEDTAIVFQYIFSICNSIQGFLVFLFIMLRDNNARDLWSSLLIIKMKTRVKTMPIESQARSNNALMEENFRSRLLSEASISSATTM